MAAHRTADLALSLYLEDLARDRRVLWIGDPSGGGPEGVARSARTVRVLSPEGGRRGAGRRVRISALKPGRLSFKERSFDVVIVPDLIAVAMAEPHRIDDIRDLLGDEGVLVAGTETASGGLGYDALFDLVSARFTAVRMVGQAPFLGWSVVDFEAAAGAHDVVVDGSLVDPQEDKPVRYLAIGADRSESMDAYSVIRVPEREAPSDAAPSAQLELRDAEVARLERELSERLGEVDAANEHSEGLEEKLADRSTELERLREDLERANTDLEQAHADLEQAHTDLEQAHADLEQAHADLEQANGAVSSARADLHRASEQDRGDDTEADESVARLEQKLLERGRELREARDELKRREVLVRDMAEEIRELSTQPYRPDTAPSAATPSGPGPSDVGAIEALRQDREAAVERALSAEARHAEAQFRIDELLGRLSGAEEESVDRLQRREAQLVGTEHGLRARIAEQEELRELAEGMLSLAQFDIEALNEKNLALERRVGEITDQLELELVRARGPAQKPGASEDPSDEPALAESERRLSARVSELSGQLMACQDLAEQVTSDRDHARAENLRLTALVSTVDDRFEGSRIGYERRIAELVAAAAERDSEPSAEGPVVSSPTLPDAEVASLKGQIAGLEARLAGAEATRAALASELEAARLEASPAEHSEGPGDAELLELKDEADVLREQVAQLRQREGELVIRLSDAEELSELEAARTGDLASSLAARDALVSRLQMDLAAAEQAAGTAEQRLHRDREENGRLREALIAASEQVDEAEAASQRVTELQSQLSGARGDLSSARQELQQELAEADAELERAQAAREASRATLRQTRDMLVELVEQFGGPEAPRAAGITAVGAQAPDVAWNEPGAADSGAHQLDPELVLLRERIAQMEAEASDRDTLLRTLMAQLEEREDRLVALGESDGPATGGEDTEVLRRELLDLRQRASQLSEELTHERAARRAVEDSIPPGDDVKRLHETLTDRDSELLAVRGRITSAERDIRSLRDAAAKARSGLESLLGEATAGGDPATAERIGNLLRVLSRI